eukprot:10206082-Alexandrium_andersonii.AAC.1
MHTHVRAWLHPHTVCVCVSVIAKARMWLHPRTVCVCASVLPVLPAPTLPKSPSNAQATTQNFQVMVFVYGWPRAARVCVSFLANPCVPKLPKGQTRTRNHN